MKKIKIKVKIKNPYPKYSFNSALLCGNKPVWGLDADYVFWEITHGNGIPIEK